MFSSSEERSREVTPSYSKCHLSKASLKVYCEECQVLECNYCFIENHKSHKMLWLNSHSREVLQKLRDKAHQSYSKSLTQLEKTLSDLANSKKRAEVYSSVSTELKVLCKRITEVAAKFESEQIADIEDDKAIIDSDLNELENFAVQQKHKQETKNQKMTHYIKSLEGSPQMQAATYQAYIRYITSKNYSVEIEEIPPIRNKFYEYLSQLLRSVVTSGLNALKNTQQLMEVHEEVSGDHSGFFQVLEELVENKVCLESRTLESSEFGSPCSQDYSE